MSVRQLRGAGGAAQGRSHAPARSPRARVGGRPSAATPTTPVRRGLSPCGGWSPRAGRRMSLVGTAPVCTSPAPSRRSPSPRPFAPSLRPISPHVGTRRSRSATRQSPYGFRSQRWAQLLAGESAHAFVSPVRTRPVSFSAAGEPPPTVAELRSPPRRKPSPQPRPQQQQPPQQHEFAEGIAQLRAIAGVPRPERPPTPPAARKAVGQPMALALSGLLGILSSQMLQFAGSTAPAEQRLRSARETQTKLLDTAERLQAVIAELEQVATPQPT